MKEVFIGILTNESYLEKLTAPQDLFLFFCLLGNEKTVVFQYYKPVIVATLPERMNAELNTAYTMTCGATG